MKEKSFISHKANGFYLRFPNGNGLSTIWGAGSYTENYVWKSPDGDIVKTYTEQIPTGSNDVEVMPDCPKLVKRLLDATFPEEENGSVFGHLSFEKWLKMVNILNENPSLPKHLPNKRKK